MELYCAMLGADLEYVDEEQAEGVNQQQWSDNVKIIDQCLEQQAQYSEEQIQQIYETNHIPEEHQTLFTKFHNAYTHRLRHSNIYVQEKGKKSQSCCRFVRDQMPPNTIPPSSISLKEWTHIATYHTKIYEALQRSQHRNARYIRADIIRSPSHMQNSVANHPQSVSLDSVHNLLSDPEPPISKQTSWESQCTEAEG
eukprot:315156_1